MAKYNVTLNYIASASFIVEASDEGEALDKGRTMAEEADINQFQLGLERESTCQCIGNDGYM